MYFCESLSTDPGLLEPGLEDQLTETYSRERRRGGGEKGSSGVGTLPCRTMGSLLALQTNSVDLRPKRYPHLLLTHRATARVPLITCGTQGAPNSPSFVVVQSPGGAERCQAWAEPQPSLAHL